jgi:hypothetical protein
MASCAPVGGALWAGRWTARPAGASRRVANPPQVANLPHKSIRVTYFANLNNSCHLVHATYPRYSSVCLPCAILSSGWRRRKLNCMRRTLLTALLATACSLPAAPIKIHGYITDLQSPKNFAIDDYKIMRDDNLAFELDKGDYPDATFHPEDLRIGTELEVQGDFNDSTHELRAAGIKVLFNDNERVKRFAVIEHTAVLERTGNVFKGIVHADGQTIRVDDETHFVLKEWQSSQLSPGMSITYEGYRNRDGSITATRLEAFQNGTGKAEQHLWRDGAPKIGSGGEISIQGVKYKLEPDAEAQSYVQRIGAKLVPAYFQHELSGGAARIVPFEFYLLANDDFNAHAFPNGIVLVNSGVFRVLTTEAQLAAVLGHEIAHATQQHSYRELKYEKKKGATEMREKGYAGGNKGDPLSAAYSRMMENQADRVGLEYMVAAGYDPREAPEVWKQVARTAGHKAGFWDGRDDATTRRSYLLAELRNNYAGVDFQSYIRDRDEFDGLAERFGNTSIAQHAPDNTGAAMTPGSPSGNRPGYLPWAASRDESQEKRFGANAVNLTSDPPGADVLLNGRVIGKTPMVLPTGNVGLPYIITLRRTGYQSWTGQLVSVPGRTNLRVELLAAR